jgi:hypothetical protein
MNFFFENNTTSTRRGKKEGPGMLARVLLYVWKKYWILLVDTATRLPNKFSRRLKLKKR